MQERWAVAANFVGSRPFRWGAKVRIVLWAVDRVRVEGLNFYGRRVDCWVSVGDLRSFRPMMHANGDRPTKDEAAADAAACDRARFAWGRKCPLLTWAQHRAAAGK